MRKDKYKNSLRKANIRVVYTEAVCVRAVCAKVICTKAVWRTVNGEKYSKQLILESGFQIADLVRESKHRFGLVIRLIANKYYVDLFCYLSFLPPAIGFSFFAVQIFDLSLILD